MTQITIDKKAIRISVGVFITLLLFVATTAWSFSQQFERQNNQLQQNTQSINGLKSDMKSVQELDVRLTVIETKLTNVESLLQEMRRDNREERNREQVRYDDLSS